MNFLCAMSEQYFETVNNYFKLCKYFLSYEHTFEPLKHFSELYGKSLNPANNIFELREHVIKFLNIILKYFYMFMELVYVGISKE
jgi:hypothetical protein